MPTYAEFLEKKKRVAAGLKQLALAMNREVFICQQAADLCADNALHAKNAKTWRGRARTCVKDTAVSQKRGRCIVYGGLSGWSVGHDIPTFTQDRGYIRSKMKTEDGELVIR